MQALLDSDKQRKYDIISAIYNAKKLSLSYNDLQTVTDLAPATLTKILKEIFRDLAELNRENVLKVRKQGNQKVYSLTQKNLFVRNELFCKYLQESIKFKLLIDIFEDNNQSIEGLAFKHFISVSTLKREFNSLKKILKKFKISVSGYTHIQLKGNETSIRMFYSHLFYAAYQGTTWPFKSIEQWVMYEYTHALPEIIFTETDLKSHLFISYIIAVTANRCLQGYKVDAKLVKVPLYEDDKNPDFKQKKQVLQDVLTEVLPKKFTASEIETEVLFIYSIILAHKTYFDNSIIIPDFFLNPDLNQFDFMSDVSVITKDLLAIFNVDYNSAVFYKLFYSVCIIHYRAYLFNDVLPHIPLYWTTNKIVMTENDIYYQFTYSQLKEKLDFSKTQLSQLHTDYLVKSYSIALQNFISEFFIQKKLKVLFLATETDYNFLYNAFSSNSAQKYIAIETTTVTDPEIDVIVSDTMLDPRILHLSAKIPIIYFESAYCLEYLGPIGEKLFTLQLTKNNILI